MRLTITVAAMLATALLALWVLPARADIDDPHVLVINKGALEAVVFPGWGECLLAGQGIRHRWSGVDFLCIDTTTGEVR